MFLVSIVHFSCPAYKIFHKYACINDKHTVLSKIKIRKHDCNGIKSGIVLQCLSLSPGQVSIVAIYDLTVFLSPDMEKM